MSVAVSIELPEKLVWVFNGVARWRIAHGGRGSGKTYGFALMSAVRGMMLGMAGVTGQILCAREHLNSLDESSMEEVKAAIRSRPWLDEYYEIGEKYIRSKDGRIRYVFAGLRHNLDSIKSKARVLIAWVDEAENVSEAAWRKLVPTVRAEGADWQSEIWVTYNPESEDSATHKRFRKHKIANARIVEINWMDNPWFPKVLNDERKEDLRLRPDTYDHVWGGQFLVRTEAQVFAGRYAVHNFEIRPEWHGPYYGIDFGFAKDPTTATELYVGDGDLWIRRDCGRVGLELDHTADFMIGEMPNIETHISRADSARPESISYLKRHGLPQIQSVKKWPGSVEDGVEHMKSYGQIHIHEEDAPGNSREFRLYSYEVDRLTGEIKPKIKDAHNHYIDADRYGLVPLMKYTGYSLMDVM